MNTNLRHISYCLIASLLFAACRKESHPLTPEEPEEQYAISMNAASVTDMTTSRALVTNDADLQKPNTNLGVFAYKQLADDTKVSVFENERIYYTNTDGWKYDNTKYWDKAATKYCFVAYYPYLTDNIRYNNQNLTISKIPCWQTIDGSETDYLVANSHGTAEEYLATTSKSVGLNFRHILSQLEVRVAKNDFLQSTYTLTKVEYVNVPENVNSTYTYNGTNGTDNMTTTMASSITIDDATRVVGKEGDLDKEGDYPRVIFKHLVVPFDLTDQNQIEVKLSYKVGQSTDTKTPQVATGVSKLEAGKRYVLTLIFNSGAVIDTSLEILDWVNEDVYEDKYNW